MIMDFICFFFWFPWFVSGYNTAENHLPVNSRIHPSNCNGAAHTVLVEKFFNYVFTEFRDNPPVCICVKMCIGQYTYCFPNACTKQKEYKQNISDTTTKKIKDDMNVTENRYYKDRNPFVDFYDDIKMSDLVSSHAHTTPTTPSTENEFIDNFHTDLFKEHYTSMLKYRRIPSFQLRYNLKELVKHRNDYASSDVDAVKAIWPYKLNKVSSQIIFEIIKPNIIFHKTQPSGNRLSLYDPNKINYVKRDVLKIKEDEDNSILKSLKKDDPLSENNPAFDDLSDNEVVRRNDSRQRNGYFLPDIQNAESLLNSRMEHKINFLLANVSSEIKRNIRKSEEKSLKYLNKDKIYFVNISEYDSQLKNNVNGTLVSAFESTTEYHPEISRVQNMVGFVDGSAHLTKVSDTRTKKRFSGISRSMLEAKKRILLLPRRMKT